MSSGAGIWTQAVWLQNPHYSLWSVSSHLCFKWGRSLPTEIVLPFRKGHPVTNRWEGEVGEVWWARFYILRTGEAHSCLNVPTGMHSKAMHIHTPPWLIKSSEVMRKAKARSLSLTHLQQEEGTLSSEQYKAYIKGLRPTSALPGLPFQVPHCNVSPVLLLPTLHIPMPCCS